MTRKTYGSGFDAALGPTDRTRFKRWYEATSRVRKQA
jgi:hypothetical protein